MVFPYHAFRRHLRLSITASGSCLLTWHKAICRCLLRRQTSPKTAFRTGSSGLYRFTHMPFGLSNSGSSFCPLMEMCLGNQQFVTLLLYLDDICVFATSIDEILDHIELVFKWQEEFNLKIKPKKCYFFQHSIVFHRHVLSAEGISANPEKVEKVKTGQYQPTQKNYKHFWGLPPTTTFFILRFSAITKCLHQL